MATKMPEPQPVRTRLSIATIRVDGGTQPRAALDQEVIEDYSEAMRAGVIFPPVTVFHDGAHYWLADGFHRVTAAGSVELEAIAVEVRQGTREDAQWFSFSANQGHGLRRTNADKQRAIQAALEHPKSRNLSDREIARHVGVNHETIHAAREKISGGIRQIESDTTKRTVTRGRTQYEQNVSNIGSAKLSKARTYSDTEPDSTLAPYGVESLLRLIESARAICKLNLKERELDCLSVDLGGIQILEQAASKLQEIIGDARRLFDAKDAQPA